MTAPAKIHAFVPFDRSGRVRWLLEELGHPYEDTFIDFGPEGSLSPAFRAKSPGGKVPFVEVGDAGIFETGAALLWIADRHGDLAPKDSDPDRPAYLSWLFYLSATIDPIVFEFLRPDMPEELRPARRERAAQEIPRHLDAIEGQLGGRETMLERGFTPVDIQTAACLDYARVGGALEGRDGLLAYLEAMKARPAAKAAKTWRQ